MATTLDSPIPSGAWTLYWHPSEGKDWSFPSYTSFGTMTTWHDFLKILTALKVDTLSDGMFFLMRGDIPPLWENCNNVYGGAYSFRILKSKAGLAFVRYAIAAMLKEVVKNDANLINGLSISPKKTHNIVKVWNTDARTHNRKTDLVCHHPDVLDEEIVYTPFTDKKM
jgi:hypothetical protein